VHWLENERHWFLLAVVVYGLSMLYSIFLWRDGFRHHNRINYGLLALVFFLHTVAMVKRGFSFQRCPVNNLYEAMTFVAWTIVAAYLIVGLLPRLRFLGAFASPLLFGIGVFSLMPALDVRGPRPEFVNGFSSLHAALILLSYGAFGLSSIAGLMYLTQEHNLKFHKLRAVVSLLPPIQRLERVMGRLLFAGFILLSAGLFVGSVWIDLPPGKKYIGDPMVLWSIFVWCLYLTLLVMRWFFSQGGRRFAWGALGSFAFVLMTFWGFYLLSGIHRQ
jgi:HemX protein